MDTDKYIGRLLDNRYEIQEVIGIGGMAVVYKARCHRLNRLVAIKILKDDFGQDEEFRRRFHAEGQAVAMLSHPNIVSVYDVSSSTDADYIVMELIDGISLKQYMEKKGVLNWKETLHFAIQIAKALEHAHSRGIVHRDIKPHNVMVLKNGSVKVADFGIARVMSKGNTLTKEALGSVHYISPEQAKGGRVDNRSDIYSLGVVMYEMMTGRPPYDGESPVAVAIQHINGGAVMPSTLNPNIPGGLEQIIMKAMGHEPAARYDTATAMLYDMDEFRKNPAMLFDYNTPPLDDVTRIHSKPLVVDTPHAAKTTAEIVAASKSSVPRTRQSQSVSQSSRTRQQTSARRTEGSRKPSTRTRTDAEEEYNRNKIATIMVIVCALVAIVAIALFLISFFQDNVTGPTEEYVYVPTYVAKNYDSIPATDGIVIELAGREYDEEYEKGLVLKQEPKQGERVVKGTVVRLWVSLGPQPQEKTMMLLVDLDQEQAENFLIGQGLVPIVRQENSDEFEVGRVIRTDPAEDEPLEEGQVVTLWVSSGPEIIKKPMPNVVGYNAATAERILSNAGFANIEQEPVDGNEPAGQVVWQSEEKNTQVDITTVIVLKVSNGPTEPPTEATTEPSTEATTEPTTQPTDASTEPSTEAADPTEATQPVMAKTKTVTWWLLEGTLESYTLIVKNNGATISTQVIPAGQQYIQLELTGSGVQQYELYIKPNNGEETLYKTETVDFTA